MLRCLIASAPVWLIANAVSAADTPRPKPNVVILLADDLGWGDVGYNGSIIDTPNIDRLAGEGVQLTNFRVEPLCSPTRAGLMTGRWPIRYGMFDLDRDPGEEENIEARNPEVVAALLEQLHEFRRLKPEGIPHFQEGRKEFVAPK